MSKLVIIRGNSGSGKTSAAKLVQHEFGQNIMLISQDVVRRDILHVKDGKDTLALPLLKELLLYGKNHCAVTVLEGILHAEWYQPLFQFAKEIFKDNIYAYYYDLSFAETLVRHETRFKKAEFGEKEMRRWWREKDFIKIIPERIITADMSLDDTVQKICKDLME